MATIKVKHADILSITTTDQPAEFNFPGTVTNNGSNTVYYRIGQVTVTATDTRDADSDKGRILPGESINITPANQGSPHLAAFKTASGTSICDFAAA